MWSTSSSAIQPPRFLVYPSSLLIFGLYMFQFRRYLFHRDLPQLHVLAISRNYVVLFSPDLIIEFGIVDTAVGAAALFARERATGHCVRYCEHGLEIAR